MRALAKKLVADVASWDIIGVIGAGLVAYGAGLAYRPAGFITGGALLLVAAIRATR